MANITAARPYAAVVRQEAERNGLAPALLAALIDHETGGTWNPRAIRVETAINDASRGLTQILFRTAQGAGYTGDAAGLFDPATNVFYGAKYLAGQIKRAGSLQGGLSAYNGGYNPSAGFGAVLTRPRVGIVLARDPQGKVSLTRDAPAGEFANQPYVDSIMTRARAFAASQEWNAAVGTSPTSQPASVTQLMTPAPKAAPVAKPTAASSSPSLPTPAKLALGAGAALAALLLWKALT